MESLLWHLTNRTAETLLIFSLFHLLLAGLAFTWLGGEIFDLTHSYHIAFIITIVVGFLVLGIAIVLKRFKPVVRHQP